MYFFTAEPLINYSLSYGAIGVTAGAIGVMAGEIYRMMCKREAEFYDNFKKGDL